jgi:AcrR family transcriptional regulator
VFGELGYGAASVRDIIRRTDLAAGTFYNHFPDKESIFRALIEEIGEEARHRVRAARRQASSPAGFIADGYRAYFQFIVEDPANQAFLSRNAGTIRAMFEDGQLPIAASELREDLEAAIARGDVPSTDVAYLAHVMVAVGLELGERLLERDPPDVDGATSFAAAFVLGGIAALA